MISLKENDSPRLLMSSVMDVTGSIKGEAMPQLEPCHACRRGIPLLRESKLSNRGCSRAAWPAADAGERVARLLWHTSYPVVRAGCRCMVVPLLRFSIASCCCAGTPAPLIGESCGALCAFQELHSIDCCGKALGSSCSSNKALGCSSSLSLVEK